MESTIKSPRLGSQDGSLNVYNLSQLIDKGSHTLTLTSTGFHQMVNVFQAMLHFFFKASTIDNLSFAWEATKSSEIGWIRGAFFLFLASSYCVLLHTSLCLFAPIKRTMWLWFCLINCCILTLAISGNFSLHNKRLLDSRIISIGGFVMQLNCSALSLRRLLAPFLQKIPEIWKFKIGNSQGMTWFVLYMFSHITPH